MNPLARSSTLLALGLLLANCSGTTKSGNSPDTGADIEEDSPPIIFEDTSPPEDVPFWWDTTKDRKPKPDLNDEDEFTPPDIKDVKDLKDNEEPDEIEEPDIDKPDIPCMPNCTDKICGADGCGGVCGFCEYGYLCADGKCEPSLCPAQCTTLLDGKEAYMECGANGCGGYCGYCMDDTYCGIDGFCYPGSCDGNCGKRNCGDDGCGHSCGNCQQGDICSQEGKCIPNPCGDVTYKGKCTSKYDLVECLNYNLKETNCLTIPDRQCGWDANVGKYSCVPEGSCQPNCLFDDGTMKECGDDGCWGWCGTCPSGWGCAAGICTPSEGGDCAWIDNVVGACAGTIRWFCSSGILYGYDCKEKEGKLCGWKATANLGDGGYDCL